MIIGIDATNIRRGGGVTHLVELLRHADPACQGIKKVVVWSGRNVLSSIEDRPWLQKMHEPVFEKGLIRRAAWQRFRLSRAARNEACDVLFVPGGSYAGTFRPMATLSQNLLPFQWQELKRFGWSGMTVKLLLLRLVQTQTFRRAQGLLFLTTYARNAVMRIVRRTDGMSDIVSHGIDPRFFVAPRVQRGIESYSEQSPFKILYVSIVDMYKHQWVVAETVHFLRLSGFPVTLELVGDSYPPALARLERTLDQVDPDRNFVRYSGPIPYEALHERYASADLCVFASSCENLPIILLEGMAAGLPIACSSRGPMPEVLRDSGVYFDPENSADMARAVGQLIESPSLRTQMAAKSFAFAQAYSWQRCANHTFKFLAQIAGGAVDSTEKTKLHHV